jgi:hypothetical protein
MAWATESEVLALTGTSVAAAQLTQAQGVVELYAGVTQDVVDLTPRDSRLLRVAVAYQAAWLVSQIDVASRTEVKSLVQDGVAVTPTDGDALILAPLARRALSGLSWKRRGGTVTVSNGTRRYATLEQYTAAWMRDETPGSWRSLC